MQKSDLSYFLPSPWYNPFLASKKYYTYKMLVHTYEKSYKGDSELDDYFRFKMAASANLRMDTDGINNLM